MQIDKNFYDLIIVGGGPAGLSAAIYMARAKYRVLLLEKAGIGGQITITSEIVNYPGVERTSGKELTEQMRYQAEAFGAEFAIAEVLDMELTSEVKVIHTTKGIYRSLGVILATGANPRKLGFKGEREFQGRGVAYCATCDGEFFTGMDVFVIGGGFAWRTVVAAVCGGCEESFGCGRRRFFVRNSRLFGGSGESVPGRELVHSCFGIGGRAF